MTARSPATDRRRPAKPPRSAAPERAAPEIPGLPARRAARDLLDLVLIEGWSLEDALAGGRSFARLVGPDRGFARALASTVLRRLGQIDAALARFLERPLGKRGRGVQTLLRLGAAQILFLDVAPHAAVSTSVALADLRRETRPLKGVINAVLRKIAARPAEILEGLPLRLNAPGWLWRSWERAFGPAAAKAMAAAHAARAPLDLTLKPGAAPPEGAQILPNGACRLGPDIEVAALAGFAEGAFWVQDAAAALPARLLGDVGGRPVIDLCAAPGGKTLQLAAAGARATAVDRSAARLKRLAENLARTGLAAEVVEADILTWRPAAPAPFVLLDAPCSATGTLRRHPDVAWLKREADIAALAGLQAQALDAAAEMLAPGGTMVYAVCSLQPGEGEAQIEAFLARAPGFARRPIEPAEIGAPKESRTRAGDLRTLPHHWAEAGGMDGFFAARLVKAEAT